MGAKRKQISGRVNSRMRMLHPCLMTLQRQPNPSLQGTIKVTSNNLLSTGLEILFSSSRKVLDMHGKRQLSSDQYRDTGGVHIRVASSSADFIIQLEGRRLIKTYTLTTDTSTKNTHVPRG